MASTEAPSAMVAALITPGLLRRARELFSKLEAPVSDIWVHETLGISVSTARRLRLSIQEEFPVVLQGKRGRPRLISPRLRGTLKRLALAGTAATANAMAKLIAPALGKTPCKTTILRTLHSMDIYCYKKL